MWYTKRVMTSMVLTRKVYTKRVMTSMGVWYTKRVMTSMGADKEGVCVVHEEGDDEHRVDKEGGCVVHEEGDDEHGCVVHEEGDDEHRVDKEGGCVVHEDGDDEHGCVVHEEGDDEHRADKEGGCVVQEEGDDEHEREVLEEDEEQNDMEDIVEVGQQFPPDHPFLVGLKQYLTSRHGKRRSEREANQICSAVSRYLSFASPELDPQNLYNIQKLDTYLRNMEVQGMKASTQHAALCRLKQGLTYVNLSLDPLETVRAEKCLTLLTNWLSTLAKEARVAKRTHLEDMSDNPSPSFSVIDRFTTSEMMVQNLQSAVVKLRKGKTVTQADLRRIMLWLAGSLLHSNAQRPGAVTNATLEEYEAATVSSVGRETYKTFLVSNHKTGTTGRAKLTADRNLITHLDTFVTHIRPALEGSSSKLLFPNREGKSLDHLSRHVQRLASSLRIDLPPTATATRHAAATAVADQPETERTKVAVAMSHSRRTQELYYSLKKGKRDAVEGYRVLEGCRKGEREGRDQASARAFTQDETEVVTDYFSLHISSGKPPAIDECREFIKQHPLQRSAKQVRDKVRNLIGRK